MEKKVKKITMEDIVKGLGIEVADIVRVDDYVLVCKENYDLVYEENNEIVGFIIADIFEDRAEIIDVAVDVMYRNKKIGDKI